MGHLGHDVADFLDHRLPREKQRKVQNHLACCRECRLLVARERHLRELLRAAPVPDASEDFTARLLNHTGAIAAVRADGRDRIPHRPSRARRLALATGTAATVAAMMGTGAFIAGAQPPATDRSQRLSAVAASWPQQPTQLAAEMPSSELDQLRAAGWVCPELTDLGFRLVSAKGYEVSGHPTLQLQLTNAPGADAPAAAAPASTVIIYEQHGTASSADPVPVNAATGHPVNADGFIPDPAESAGGQLWLRPGATWQAVYRDGDTTYTISSDLPPTKVKDAVTRLGAADARSGSDSSSPDDVASRVLRGLQRLALWSGS